MTATIEPKRAPRLNGYGRKFRRALSYVWRFIDGGRRAFVNLLFIGLIVAALFAVCSDDAPKFADKTALVIAPRGALVEQLSGDPVGRARDSLLGQAEPETLLRDVIDAIRYAQDDERIAALVLDLSKLSDGGLSKLQEIAAAVRRFKESGKPVIAFADGYSQAAYYLATTADEVYLHEFGGVGLTGFGRYRMYYKDALDRLEIDWHVFRVGTYKSAAEPFLRRDMSPAAREANLDWMGDLWSAYVKDVAEARELSPAAITDYADNFDLHIQRADGDSAKAAKDAGLVDKVVQRDAVRDRLVALVGEDEKTHSFHQVSADAYVPYMRERDDARPKKGPGIGVVVARGTIQDGSHPPGVIGGDSTAALIRKARHDEDIKAIVLRVDSGGGSAFASEVIRRELALAREAGKPVVVSMGSVAASGGYWISTASDEIWASPTTITGSIGIFGMFPTFEKPLNTLLGLNTDGVATAPGAGVRPDRALDPRAARAIQIEIEKGYRRFLERVSEAREMPTADVDKIAQGRVWSGVDAHAHGLVDELGGLDDAIAAAARRAGLEDEVHRVVYVERDLKLSERIMRSLFQSTAAWVGVDQDVPSVTPGPYSRVLAIFAEQAEVLASFDDPRGVYAYEVLDVD